jgi:uncharacterized protein GlcG (DUF336 family)
MINLERANPIVDAALAEGRRLKLAPLAVVVLDSGGNLLVAKREDSAGILRIDIAHAKAWDWFWHSRTGGVRSDLASLHLSSCRSLR